MRRPRSFLLFVTVLLAAACAPSASPSTPTAARSVEPTTDRLATRLAGMVGTVVAQFTPELSPSATDCVIVGGTPGPAAPTASPSGTALPPKPRLTVCASATTIPVGATLTILARAMDIRQPDYVLMLQDLDALPNAIPLLAEITSDNQVFTEDDTVSQVFQPVSLTAHGSDLRLTLCAIAPGRAALIINWSGQVPSTNGGPGLTPTGAAQPLTLTVTP